MLYYIILCYIIFYYITSYYIISCICYNIFIYIYTNWYLQYIIYYIKLCYIIIVYYYNLLYTHHTSIYREQDWNMYDKPNRSGCLSPQKLHMMGIFNQQSMGRINGQ